MVYDGIAVTLFVFDDEKCLAFGVVSQGINAQASNRKFGADKLQREKDFKVFWAPCIHRQLERSIANLAQRFYRHNEFHL